MQTHVEKGVHRVAIWILQRPPRRGDLVVELNARSSTVRCMWSFTPKKCLVSVFENVRSLVEFFHVVDLFIYLSHFGGKFYSVRCGVLR